MLDFASVNVKGTEQEKCDAMAIAEETYCTCFAVADGKTASDTADFIIDNIVKDFKAQSDITTATIPDFLESVQEKLITNQEKGELSAGGCSMAVFLSNGKLTVWAHIGDCRVYHLKEKLLYEITPDHSDAYNRYEAGDIRYPKIRTDRTRYNILHQLGKEQDFKPTYSSPAMVKEEDSFLICTDGFWENIHERQVEKTLKRAKSAQDWLDKMTKIVEKNRARKKYTNQKDDYSAITIKV